MNFTQNEIKILEILETRIILVIITYKSQKTPPE